MSKLYFESKRDLWLGILIWGTSIFPVSAAFPISQASPAKISLILFYIGIISWFWFGTGYTFLDGNRLLIACGPVRGTVYIDKIESVEASRKPWSSAALSIDRLRIATKQGLWNSVWYISPKDKLGFIKELKKRNPNVNITL